MWYRILVYYEKARLRAARRLVRSITLPRLRDAGYGTAVPLVRVVLARRDACVRLSSGDTMQPWTMVPVPCDRCSMGRRATIPREVLNGTPDKGPIFCAGILRSHSLDTAIFRIALHFHLCCDLERRSHE